MSGTSSDSVGPVTVSHKVQGFQFRSMRGTERLSQPFRYEVELLHANAVNQKDMLGSSLTIQVDLHGGGQRYFNGCVTEFSLRGSVGNNALYTVTLRPWLALLEQRVNCRILNGTAVKMAKDIFDDQHNLPIDYQVALSDDYPSHDFVVQYRESDLNFLLRTLERDGISFHFEHAKDRHTLVLTDDHRLSVPGYERIRYRPPDVNAQELEEQFDDWRCHHTIKPGKLVLTDYHFKAPRAQLETTAASPADHPSGDLEVFDFPGDYTDHAAGLKASRRRLEALQVGHARFEGSGNVRGVTPGQVFQLEDHPSEELNRKYLVYSIDFDISTHALESGPSAAAHTGVMRTSVVAFAASEPFRPPLQTPKPRMPGVQTATVVGSGKPEIHIDPKGFGRVQIRFPWDRQGKSSCWVRVAHAWAGSSFGASFHPRVGQEVLVDFIDGDPDRPIIIGSVHNDLNRPPYTKPTQGGLKSCSTPDGGLEHYNEIRFDDEKGAELLYIQAENQQTTNVKGEQKITVGKDRSLEVTGKEVTIIKEAQTVTAKTHELTAAEGIQILQSPATKATLKEDNVTLNAGKGITLNATKTIVIDAGSKVQLEVGATIVEIDGESGIVSIKGQMIQLNC